MAIDETITQERLRLLEMAKQLGNVSAACRIMGYSRDSFYRYRELYETSGAAALTDISKRRPLHKKRVSKSTEDLIVQIALERPLYGQIRVSRLLREQGIVISPGGVRSVWLRHSLETAKKRVKALEVRLAQENQQPTPLQKQALDGNALRHSRRKAEVIECPGWLGIQASLALGSLRDLGTIYQHTFLDVYSHVVIADLYLCNDAWAAADLLQHRVLPFYASKKVRLQRVATAPDCRFCGESAAVYWKFLEGQGIMHVPAVELTGATVKLSACLHEEMLNSLYCTVLRTHRYRRLSELRSTLDAWLHRYNGEVPCDNCYCFGRPPLQVFQAASQQLSRGRG